MLRYCSTVRSTCTPESAECRMRWRLRRVPLFNPNFLCCMACDKSSNPILLATPKCLSYNKASHNFHATNVFQQFSTIATTECYLTLLEGIQGPVVHPVLVVLLPSVFCTCQMYIKNVWRRVQITEEKLTMLKPAKHSKMKIYTQATADHLSYTRKDIFQHVEFKWPDHVSVKCQNLFSG